MSLTETVSPQVVEDLITRHGEQQGAARGYNPNKRGRLSHHPLLAFVSEARMVANFEVGCQKWIRTGSCSQPIFIKLAFKSDWG